MVRFSSNSFPPSSPDEKCVFSELRREVAIFLNVENGNADYRLCNDLPLHLPLERMNAVFHLWNEDSSMTPYHQLHGSYSLALHRHNGTRTTFLESLRWLLRFKAELLVLLHEESEGQMEEEFTVNIRNLHTVTTDMHMPSRFMRFYR